jgi:MOSC domain-containing protein YiiM
MTPTVLAVARDGTHRFSKHPCDAIELVAGQGVASDAHAGTTVQHLSRIARNAAAPNLRQVHLMHAELFDELRMRGFDIAPGALGENVTTRGLDLLALPTGARLRIGAGAEIEITGLRNPCKQIESFRPGLLAAVLDRDAAGNLVRKAGVMAIVHVGGIVRAGDPIGVILPGGAPVPLVPV